MRSDRVAKEVRCAAVLAGAAAVIFFFTTQPTQKHFDYTARIASALLEGHLGLEKPPSWLNEMIPGQERYYSVFPLGAVLTMLPVALLQKVHLVHDFPGRPVAAIVAGVCVWFAFRLALFLRPSLVVAAIFGMSFLFGTWLWCNLGFAGAWQLALGVAVLGQLGSLYFLLAQRRPLVAGFFFALAVGNRTELLISAPVYLWFLLDLRPAGFKQLFLRARAQWRDLLAFVWPVVLLGALTFGYNAARFGSPLDFGYSRIPGVLEEPWYRYGLFSFHAIPWNVYKMLFEGFRDRPEAFPYFSFDPFGCSIFLVSPMLWLIFREGGAHRFACWVAIGLLSLILWSHGNPGGWEFSYRYASILLPWMLILILETGPKRFSATEACLIAASIAICSIGVYQFLWTTNIHP